MARKKFTTTLDAELLKRIKLQAVEEDRDVSELFDDMMREYLNKNRPSEKMQNDK